MVPRWGGVPPLWHYIGEWGELFGKGNGIKYSTNHTIPIRLF